MLKPQNDSVLLSDIEKRDELTAGGIYLPDNIQSLRSDEKSLALPVVAVGDGRRSPEGVDLPMEVRVGDTAVIPKFIGVKVEHEGARYRLVTEREIIAVLEKTNG